MQQSWVWVSSRSSPNLIQILIASFRRLLPEKSGVSAKVSRVPGTSKSTGFGFVTFSSDEDVEAAILALNNSLLEGQKIRVNKA
ncbi:hypothetical protein Bca4012_021181 [Brassica carinata]